MILLKPQGRICPEIIKNDLRFQDYLVERTMMRPDGRRVALGDDLCIRKCEPPPKRIASRQVMSVDA
ncbi:hypothetical protein CFB84_18880 [Burkholderia aenigmatica]|uniref:Uncharacterized protein n=1 Tax=Burkholderia aenigmatica TaxID=2015348 RepID=A0A228IMM1_9BURK|nr:hypothetical protein CFB84_18880 [Burkholderia aenigmatica]